MTHSLLLSFLSVGLATTGCVPEVELELHWERVSLRK